MAADEPPRMGQQSLALGCQTEAPPIPLDQPKAEGVFEPFELDDIHRRFVQAGFTIVREDVRGNTVNLLARKDAR